MAFLIGPKERKSRALGENLFLKAERSASQKSAMVRRPYPPGMHGKRRRTFSEYSLQLREKQKVRLAYGLREKVLKKYAQEAKQMQKVSAPEALFRLLELRIDSAVFRAGFAHSRSVARQLVSHGHVSLKGRRVTIPSLRLKIGDQVFFKEASTKKKVFEKVVEKSKKYEAPVWLEVDLEKRNFKVKGLPSSEEFKSIFNLPLVIEFYSR